VGDQDPLNLPARLVEYTNALASEVEIALVVQGQTVRALIHCERLACQAAVRRDVVPVCFPASMSATYSIFPSGVPMIPLGFTKSSITRTSCRRSADRK